MKATAGIMGVVVAVFLPASSALANTYVPNKLNDHAPNGCTHSDCTLREAVTKANGHAGADTIVLKGGKTYNLSRLNVAGDEDANATGDLDVLGSLTVKSSNKKPATVDANGIDRVFEVGPTAPVSATFKRLVIRGGESVAAPAEHGGGIYAENGGLKVLRSKVVGNSTTDPDSEGGGIAATGGTLRIAHSLIARNSAAGGGGVSVHNRATILTSTIANNRGNAGVGGGIFDGDEGTLVLKASTLVGNSTNNDGGGVETYGSATLVNDTITKNHTDGLGGGVEADASSPTVLNAVTVARNTANGNGGGIEGTPLTVSNSLIALNASSGLGPDCHPGPTIVSAGHNLIGDTTDCGTSFGISTQDITNVNPRIAQLADNGGPTKTIALKAHSKAINHAGSSAPPRDQRGVKRGAKPDIGAFERR